CHQSRSQRVSAYPLSSTTKNPCVPRVNWLVFKPSPKVFCQCQSRRIAALRIFLEALEADRCQIAIYFGIPQTRLPWLGCQKKPDSVVGCSACKRWMTGKQMIKHRAQSIDIGRAGELIVIPQRLFGCHVTRRA